MTYRASKWWIITIVMVIACIGIVGIALAQTPDISKSTQASNDKIEAALATKLASSPADYIVRFKEQADLTQAYKMSWEARGKFVYDALRRTSDRTQERTNAILDRLNLRHHSFLAGNEMYVWSGSLESAQYLAALPEVELLRGTHVYHLDPVVRTGAALQSPDYFGVLLKSYDVPAASSIVKSPARALAVVDWGIIDTRADQFWSAFGVQGDGIVVANIDSGVEYYHSALYPNYKCAANPSDPACWFDPGTINCIGLDGGPCDTPYLGIYHGTHTMGTMVADDNPNLLYQVGMAPNSHWIACLGCPLGGCPEFDINSCADWILAPGGDPANRPNVVNNSWGGGGGNPWYLDKVNAWRAAGIFPAFSAGNNYFCDSIESPGDYQESFASAAHDVNRVIADFSSKGPSSFGDDPYTKPNLSAPGVDIISTQPGENWDALSGTSMASPHTAGAVALLWSCNPSLVGQVDLTFQILQGTTDLAPAGSCGAPPDGEGNYTYGYGYLDVYNQGLLWCGPTGKLDGHVYDESMNPINLAHVFSSPGPYGTSTDNSGYYTMSLPVGAYAITAEAFGYYSSTAAVDVLTDTITVQDFTLVGVPSSIISGTITDALTGWPLYAYVGIAGYPGGGVWNDPMTGYYEVSLPNGPSYDFTVSAWVPGYLDETRTISSLGGDQTQNFGLNADLTACIAPGYTLNGACNPPAGGGLVVGNVDDTQLGIPLTGATVSNDSGGSAATVVTIDPNVGDSFYTLFSPSGMHAFTASFPQYNTVSEPVAVLSGGTVLHNFHLPSGYLAVDPASLQTDVPIGGSLTMPVALTNQGDGTLNFEIHEVGGGTLPATDRFFSHAVQPPDGSVQAAADVWWLEETPVTGTLPSDSVLQVDVTFVTTPTTPMGTYTATLVVLSDDPYNGTIEIPVTMTVVSSTSDVDLGPDQALSGAPGEEITYTLTLSNLGDAPTTVEVSLSGNNWDVSLPETSFDLGIGGMVAVVVNVTIPVDAVDGDMDGVTITATGMGGATDSSVLTTTAEGGLIFLPLIMGHDNIP